MKVEDFSTRGLIGLHSHRAPDQMRLFRLLESSLTNLPGDFFHPIVGPSSITTFQICVSVETHKSSSPISLNRRSRHSFSSRSRRAAVTFWVKPFG